MGWRFADLYLGTDVLTYLDTCVCGLRKKVWSWHLSSYERFLFATHVLLTEGVSRNSRAEAITKYATPNKRVRKLPTSQLCATWHTDSPDMVVLPSAGASRYHNCCIDGGTSPEYFGFILVLLFLLTTSNWRNAKFSILYQWRTVGGVQPLPPEIPKLSQIPKSVENKSVTT
jgi:hypothetical protein